MSLRTVATALALALCCTSVAHAQDDDEESGPNFGRPGPYVAGGFNVNFVAGWDSVQDLADAQDLDYSIDPSYGFTAGVGYRLSPRVAVEGQVDYGFDADVKVDGNKSGEIKTWVTTLDFKGYLLTGRFQPFAVMGLGAGFANGAAVVGSGVAGIDETGFVMRFGGGLDSYITENIAIFVDGSWVLSTGRLSDVDLATVGAGVMYRF
jgi:opacity protein-like surface antigen